MIPRITSTALLAVLVLAMAAGAAPAEPVLSVNGQNIDSSKLYDYMVRRHGYPSLLKLLVAEAIDQAATAAGITITDEEIAAEVAARRESLDRTAIETGVDFDQMLLSRGQTVEMFSDGERTLLQLRKMVADDVNITDETLATYYQGHPDEFRLKEAMKVSYIRLALPEKQEDMQKVIDQATEMRQMIIRGDLTFAQAAKEFSVDERTKVNGGKLDRWTTRGNTPFLKAAFGLLQNGDVSDVIGFPGLGLYLLQRDEYQRDYLLEYDEVKDDLRNLLDNQLSTRLVAAKQRELLKAAEVEWLLEWPEGSFRPVNLETAGNVEP